MCAGGNRNVHAYIQAQALFQPSIPVGCSSGFRDSACVVLCKDQARKPDFECRKMGEGTRFGQARKESPASVSFRPEPSQATP